MLGGVAAGRSDLLLILSFGVVSCSKSAQSSFISCRKCATNERKWFRRRGENNSSLQTIDYITLLSRGIDLAPNGLHHVCSALVWLTKNLTLRSQVTFISTCSSQAYMVSRQVAPPEVASHSSSCDMTPQPRPECPVAPLSASGSLRSWGCQIPQLWPL